MLREPDVRTQSSGYRNHGNDIQAMRAIALTLSSIALMILLLPAAESLQRLATGSAIMASDLALATMLVLILATLQWGWRFQARVMASAPLRPAYAPSQLRLVGGTDFEARAA